MDAEILQEINKLVYYVEEYNKGNEEYRIHIEALTKAMLHFPRSKVKYFIYFKTLIKILELQVNILTPYLNEDEDVNILFEYCNLDIKRYYDAAKYVKTAAKKCLKEDNFEQLDTIYLLSIHLSLLLSGISDYLGKIRSIQSYSQSGIAFILPNNIEKEREENLFEINACLKKLNIFEYGKEEQ